PALTVGNRYPPASLLTASRVRLRLVSVSVTFAPGTAAPDSSRTVPLTAAPPRVAWADRFDGQTEAIRAASKARLEIRMRETYHWRGSIATDLASYEVGAG